MAAMRDYVKSQFATLLKQKSAGEPVPFNMEKSIFNWSIRETKFRGSVPSWENPIFKNNLQTNEITKLIINATFIFLAFLISLALVLSFHLL